MRLYLKTKYNLYIEISYVPIEKNNISNNNNCQLEKLLHEVEVYRLKDNNFDLIFSDGGFLEEEKAIEKGILEALNILKKEDAEQKEANRAVTLVKVDKDVKDEALSSDEMRKLIDEETERMN